jgi:hypothetical protein
MFPTTLTLVFDDRYTYNSTGKDGQIDVAVVVGGLGPKESIGHKGAQFGSLDTVLSVAARILL